MCLVALLYIYLHFNGLLEHGSGLSLGLINISQTHVVARQCLIKYQFYSHDTIPPSRSVSLIVNFPFCPLHPQVFPDVGGNGIHVQLSN